MPKCRACGADIIWLKTKTGKPIPCNPVLVKYWQKHGGAKKIVTQDGDVIACETEPGIFDRTADGSGYIPHWSTCPKADEFKRKPYACMPLVKNVGMLDPVPPDWRLTTCPVCGELCYESHLCRKVVKEQGVKAVCTECALAVAHI